MEPVGPAVTHIAAVHLVLAEAEHHARGAHPAGDLPRLGGNGVVHCSGRLGQKLLRRGHILPQPAALVLEGLCRHKGRHFAVFLAAHAVEHAKGRKGAGGNVLQKGLVEAGVVQRHRPAVKIKIVLVVAAHPAHIAQARGG